MKSLLLISCLLVLVGLYLMGLGTGPDGERMGRFLLGVFTLMLGVIFTVVMLLKVGA